MNAHGGNLNAALLSEWNQSEKAISSKITNYMWHSGGGKAMETVKDQWARGYGRRMSKWSTENFHDSDIPCDVIIIVILLL